MGEARVEFIVVGGVAGVLQGAPIVTFDLDLVHRRTPENVQRLLGVLSSLHARYRDPRDLFPAAGRPKDLAALPALRATLDESRRSR
jgi:hypothetical protein